MTRTPRGRRPGAPDTRAEILAAARSRFAEQGYAGTSLRAVATDAGVDAALVHHYFGGKDDLFLAALDLGIDPRVVIAGVTAGGVDGVGERLLRGLLGVWDAPDTRVRLLAVVRGIVDPQGPTLVRDAMFGLILRPLADGLDIDQPERRVSLVASQVMGILMMRYVLEVPTLATMPAEQLVATYAPTLQRYLTGDLP